MDLGVINGLSHSGWLAMALVKGGRVPTNDRGWGRYSSSNRGSTLDHRVHTLIGIKAKALALGWTLGGWVGKETRVVATCPFFECRVNKLVKEWQLNVNDEIAKALLALLLVGNVDQE